MRTLLALCFTLLISSSAWAGGSRSGEQPDRQPADNSEIVLKQARAVFGLLPQRMPGSDRDTPALVALGKLLYYETELSINRTQSCSSCHPVEGKRAGADNLSFSPGALGTLGTRNAPTVLNAGFQISQFWDGRADDLAEQAKGPILNAREMGMPHVDACLSRIKQSDRILQAFHAAFPDQADPVTYNNLTLSIAAFERTLVSRGRFDLFLEGDSGALSDREKEGLSLFMNKGCIRCHNGPLLGGMLYQRLGIYHEYRNQSDPGRFSVTGNKSDRFVFKVSALRNVTLTAPYFHDGMERSMNGRALRKDSHEMRAIIAYLSWLGSDLPAELAGLLKVHVVVPERHADLDKGAGIYREFCQSCHGADGSGYRARSAKDEGIFVTPPIAGPGSFNTGAGMHRLLLTTAFVRGNMPLGTPWDRPVLTDDEAYDAAAYINSLNRPVMPGTDKDWLDLSKKPVDCPYPPYADGFSLDQHRYGPFKQIREAKKKTGT